MGIKAFFYALGITAVFCLSQTAQASTDLKFRHWLRDLRADARNEGISEETIRAALPDTLSPIASVVRLDRKQPEKSSYNKYLKNIVNDVRISEGRRLYRENYRTLKAIGDEYGVEPQYIVALWGIETNYGKNTGGFEIVPALATLAYDARRADYFRGELIKSLKIVDGGDVALHDMKGSWAGAMGQCQFMPSSWFKFAQDYDKDGKRDIWDTEADVFASAANYLSQSGWKRGTPWGREVVLPAKLDKSLIGIDSERTLQYWHDHGVRLLNGNPIPFEGAYQAAIVRPGDGAHAFIVYDNFHVIMKWNKSSYFASAVGLLGDKIKDRAPVSP